MSYSATVVKVHTRPHPNAQRLQLGTCAGNQVVVGLDTKDGDLGVFFPTDGQLSERMCEENDLYTNGARARLGLAPSDSPGFFCHKRRVRAQRFRGEKSDGLWMPLRSLDWAGDSTILKEGDSLTEFGGYLVCQKYHTPATLRVIGGRKLARRDAKCFPKHDDTKQFRFVADLIPEDSVIYITEKLHGTSGRFGYVWDEVELPWWKRGLNWLGFDFPNGTWTYLNGSKNVILERSQGQGYYGTNDFRYNVVRDIVLHKGEVLYFEIVGWVNEETPIMPPHDVTKTGLTEIRRRYGDQINYTYGCPRGEHRLYVYKIVNVNQDGVARELPWNQLVERCHELGLAHVPLLMGPLTTGHIAYMYEADNPLRRLVEAYTEGDSVLNPAQIREGVVIRVESTRGTSHIKNKQWAFGVLEGFWKEQEENVDPEEAA